MSLNLSTYKQDLYKDIESYRGNLFSINNNELFRQLCITPSKAKITLNSFHNPLLIELNIFSVCVKCNMKIFG